MNATEAATAAARLQRLAGFLQQDPDNAALLGDACDAALACASHAEAQAFLSSASRLRLQGPAWQLRRAHLCIAQGELDQARTLLEQLHAANGAHPALAHDLAYVCLLQGKAEAAHALLAPWAEGEFGGGGMPQDLLQALWLRACHHLDRTEEGWQWAQRAQASQALRPGAAGVASLIALDMDEADSARLLADIALAVDPLQHEALVARGCLALSAGQPQEAARLLERALQRNPRDGRALSVLGCANLLARNLDDARRQLEAAVDAMPDHAQTWHALGWACLLLQDKEGALSAFRAALAVDAESAEAQGALGLALVLTGDAAGAQPYVGSAERKDPREGAAALARALMAGRVAQAEVEDWLSLVLAQWSPRP